jgi:phosphoglycerate dehydrogenase-like enzyme
MNLLILVQSGFGWWNPPTWFAERLRKDFPQVEVTQRDTSDSAEPSLRDAEVLVTWSLSAAQLAAAAKLKWVHSPAAAVHALLIPELVANNIVVTNGSEVHAPAVAEHVITMILALAKELPQAARFQQKHEWGQSQMASSQPGVRDFAGATVGLIGAGSIGREVARLASALGMKVIAVRHDISRGTPKHIDRVYGMSDIGKLLREADYVVLAVPVTPQTIGLMSAERISQMKPEACLINVGRGQLLDEAAFAEAMRSHKIGGAALDVFVEEPLPKESPLWDLERVLITPHTAGVSNHTWERQYAFFSEDLRRYVAGQELLGLVDKRRGY